MDIKHPSGAKCEHLRPGDSGGDSNSFRFVVFWSKTGWERGVNAPAGVQGGVSSSSTVTS